MEVLTFPMYIVLILYFLKLRADLQYSYHLPYLGERGFLFSIFLIRIKKTMQLNEEYKIDNLAYKLYPNLLSVYSLLLEY